jgi:hypothetical protein
MASSGCEDFRQEHTHQATQEKPEEHSKQQARPFALLG